MPPALDLIGQTFHRLSVVKRVAPLPRHRWQVAWECRCACGTSIVTNSKRLRSGHTKSCGCLKRETTSVRFRKHGQTDSREYISWCGAKSRCYNPNALKYPSYGGRGITVCAEWRESFSAFLRDMGRCPEGRSLDRINNDGNYEPGNCRWATFSEQMRNRRGWAKPKPK